MALPQKMWNTFNYELVTAEKAGENSDIVSKASPSSPWNRHVSHLQSSAAFCVKGLVGPGGDILLVWPSGVEGPRPRNKPKHRGFWCSKRSTSSSWDLKKNIFLMSPKKRLRALTVHPAGCRLMLCTVFVVSHVWFWMFLICISTVYQYVFIQSVPLIFSWHHRSCSAKTWGKGWQGGATSGLAPTTRPSGQVVLVFQRRRNHRRHSPRQKRHQQMRLGEWNRSI